MSAYKFQIVDGVTRKSLVSSEATVDFLSVKVGATGLEIKETTGHFDFSAKKLTNVANATASGDVVPKGQLDTLLGLYQLLSEKGQANGYTPLGADGLIPSQYLPAVAITDTFVVASQAAQVALTAQVGDVAVRTDENKTYILRIADPSVFANWQEILTPGAPVQSVNGQTGNVSLNSDQVPEGSTNLYYTAARAALKQDALTAGAYIKLVGSTISFDGERNFVNDNAGSVSLGQIAYIKSNGAIDLARADQAGLADEPELAIVAATVAAAATGKALVTDGIILGGYSGLTPGKPVYVSKSTAGGVTQDISGFVAGDSVYMVGKAISATEIKYKPQFLYQIS